MGMSLDLAIPVQLLGSSKVVGLSVDEESNLHTLNCHGDREGSVGLDGTKVLGSDELGGRHAVNTGDATNGYGVAGASSDLLAIGDELTSAEVDEVVGGGERWDLANCGNALSVFSEATSDDTGIQS